MLKCGLAEVDITPPPGSSIPGYTTERKTTGMHDPLFAKAWVVESGADLAVFVFVDALFIPRREVERIRRSLEERIGVTPERVFVSATHTHTGPPVRRGFDGSSPDAYLDWMADKAVEAVLTAFGNRREASVGADVGNCGTISFNRRYRMRNGEVRTNPGFLNPDIVGPVGPIDPDVSVLRIDAADGTPLGILTNFACHPDTVGGTMCSGDYPAVLSRELKRRLGDRVVSLFMLGACGDINHHDTSRPRPGDKGTVTTKMGLALAEEVIRVRESIRTTSLATICSARTFLDMVLRCATSAEVARAQQVLNGGDASENEKFYARQVLDISTMPKASVPVEVQALSVGETVFFGLPAEIFVELGLAVKQASEFPHTFIGTLCNGSIYGYVCTIAAYEQGGYETRLRPSRIAPGTGERIVAAAIEAGKRLAQSEPE